MSAGEGSPRLVVPAGVWVGIADHLETAYPDEGCGVLVGREEAAARVVGEAVGASNEWGGRDDRYAVDPDLVRDLMVREEDGGPAVLGFYHSHPDAEPVPSATDRELGWPWYDYLIVPVARGKAGRPRVWRFGGRGGPPREGTVEGAVGDAPWRETRRRQAPQEEGRTP